MERRKKSNSGASQKACLFKIDNELLDWLDKQPNKGRYVNELIKRDMQAGDSVGYAAAVEAETRRQNVADEEIDGEDTMRCFQTLKRGCMFDTVILWKHRDADKYDGLFEDARTVKRTVPSARITTAEAEGIKLESCLIARIQLKDIVELEHAGTKYFINEYKYQSRHGKDDV